MRGNALLLGGLGPLAVALAVSSLAGCATGPAPVSVTRFSLAPDVARGSVAPAPGGPASLEQRASEDAVGQQLARIGFPAAPDARYLYTTEVTRDLRRGPPRRSPFSIGIGGGTGGYGSGVGLGVGANFPIGRARSGDVLTTRLAVRLIDRTTQQVVWEGRAEGSEASDREAGIARLAAALFRDFPGPSGRTISVP